MQLNYRDGNLDTHPYHPLAEFKHGNEVVTDAMIRLKGHSSWREAIEADDNPPKMQFVISFNEVDPSARFHGMRKLELDMPRIDPSFLRQRVALSFMRALGVPAQCANSGRLFINGAYYGLFTNLERPDRSSFSASSPAHADGDLWDGGWRPQDQRGHRCPSAPAPRRLLGGHDRPRRSPRIADMDEALARVGGEAMLADADGYWIGHQNFFLYDHPTRGWLWIPHDLDAAIDWLDRTPTDLLLGLTIVGRPWPHYAAVIADPSRRERYVAALRHALRGLRRGEARRSARSLRGSVPTPRPRIHPPFTSTSTSTGSGAASRRCRARRHDRARGWPARRRPPARSTPTATAPVLHGLRRRRPERYPGAAESAATDAIQSCDGSDLDGC